MALRGDLASVDLAQVFQMLALNKKVGLLSIHSAKSWRVLYFDQRGVTVHHNPHQLCDRVVSAFVRTGRLDGAALEEVREHAVRMGQPLLDSLLAGGYLDAAEIEDQYRAELEEEIYDLFFCHDARFEFHENTTSLPGREGAVDERFFFNCDSIIMEAARRIDEWAFISERIPTVAEVLVATVESIDAEQFGSDAPAVFELLDGRRNIARVIEVTGLSSFVVCKVLSQLADAQAVAPVANEELLPLADECMAAGRLQDAISLYERAIELGVGLPDSHSATAKAYQAAEEYELAVYHLSCEAELRIGEGDLRGAAERLLAVRNLVPTDLDARQRLVELTVAQDGAVPDGFDPLTEGKELVDLMVEFGDIERVRGLLERLLLVAPNDPDLKKALVNVHVRAGDQKRVAQLYESIADDLVRMNKPLEAVGYLQKILLIDRSRADVSERVRRLYEFDERSRRRSRALGVLAGLFCLLLVLGAAYWFYNDRAEQAFVELDIRDALQREDFAGARATLEEFVLVHPLTTAIARAKEELQKVASAQEVFEARRSAERAARDKELQAVRDRYRASWERHRELFRTGHPEEALTAVRETRELIATAGGADDVAWGLEQQVERTFQTLTKFLGDAKALAERYDERLRAGDWQGARTAAQQLHADFDVTAEARRVRLPVMVVTRPAGAQLLHDGKPLMRPSADGPVPVTTPGLVLCPVSASVALTVEMAGFAPRELVVDGSQQDRIEAVLAVVPERRVTFDAAVQTGIGLGDGWIAVGLRGGRLGLARVDGSERQVRELDGLEAVDGVPALQGGRAFFVTNENSIHCMALEPEVAVAGWPVRLDARPTTPLMVAEGRVGVVDGNGLLQVWEQATGRRVCSVALGGGVGGPPAILRRVVYVGTADGRVLAFDAADGRSVGVLRAPAGITTGVRVDEQRIVFGCADGVVRAVDFDAGKVLWSHAVGRAPRDHELAANGARVLVADDARLTLLDAATGEQLAQCDNTLPVAGMALRDGRVLVQVRRPKDRQRSARDVLLALDQRGLEVAWEFELDGLAPGSFGSDRHHAAFSGGEGEVILFR